MAHADLSGMPERNDESYPEDLTRLEDLNDWRVEAGRVDPREYDLVGFDGDKLGTIKSLLVSPSRQRAYLALVDAGNWFHHKLFLIPLDLLQIDAAMQQASGPFTKAQFQQAPEYQSGDRNYAGYYGYWNRFRTASAPVTKPVSGTAPITEAQRTARAVPNDVRVPVTDETAEIHKQEREAGYITIRKRVDVETQHISEPVTRTRVETETRQIPAGQQYTAGPGATTLREGETLRIPLTEEELVVEKVPRVKEEVIVHMRPETEQVERDVQLRHEHVEVDEEGDVELEEAEPTAPRREP